MKEGIYIDRRNRPTGFVIDIYRGRYRVRMFTACSVAWVREHMQADDLLVYKVAS